MQIEKTNTADREISISRLLDASIDLVWEVWTKPEHIAHWWGPNGFTTDIHKMELTENGDWLLTMVGPDGKHYPNKAAFREIVLHKKIVYEHFNPNFLATVTFEAKNEKTFLHWHMLFETAELFETVVKTFKADEGMKQNVEKLEKYLSQIEL